MMLRLTMMHIHSYSAQVPHGPTSTRTPLRSNPTSTRIRSAQLSSGEFCATGAFKPLEGLSQGGLMAHCHIAIIISRWLKYYDKMEKLFPHYW